MAKYKRRQYLVSKKFQFKYVGMILLFMFAIAFLSGYTVYYTTWLLLGEKLAGVYPQGRLVAILNKANLALLLRIICITPMVSLIGLLLSHRIAGPMFRIERFLKEVSEGDFSQRIYLRKKDELKPIAESINSLLTKLEEGRNREKDIFSRVSEKMNLLKSELEKPGPSMQALKEKARELGEEMALLDK